MSAPGAIATPATSRFGRWVLVAPPVAATCYPFLLKIFHGSVTPPDQTNLWVPTVTLLLAISVAAIAIYVYARLAALSQITVAELRIKWIALLSVATPPLYTTLGVVLYALQDPVSDVLVWVIFWVVVSALVARAAFANSPLASPWTAAPTGRVRFAHGISAALIMLIFLVLHLLNHLMGLWSPDLHRHVMDLFRHVYRTLYTQPLVIALFLFQAASGVVLVRPYVHRSTDPFRTFQVASGAYLFFYVLGHLNSVFVARVITKTQTDWDWATGAPDGLIHSAWSIRLLPHYLIAVFFVLSHLVLGARGITLAHHVPQARADQLARIGIGASAVVAVVIMLGLSGLQFGT
jgi:hypothetical protein